MTSDPKTIDHDDDPYLDMDSCDRCSAVHLVTSYLPAGLVCETCVADLRTRLVADLEWYVSHLFACEEEEPEAHETPSWDTRHYEGLHVPAWSFASDSPYLSCIYCDGLHEDGACIGPDDEDDGHTIGMVRIVSTIDIDMVRAVADGDDLR